MLSYLTSGESHGRQLTAILDGLPAGLPISIDRINYQLARRQKGFGRGERMKIEKDEVEIVSGVRDGLAMGGPITLIIHNRDWPRWAQTMKPFRKEVTRADGLQSTLDDKLSHPRPGHADLTGAVKWNHKDIRNVLERASARETAARVALGALTRQLLEHFRVLFTSHVIGLGSIRLPSTFKPPPVTDIINLSEASEVRCIDPDTSRSMIDLIRTAAEQGDTLGGVAEIIISGLPVGLGGFSQWFHRLDSRLAAMMMSVPSVKGVEIGSGFSSTIQKGSEIHDEIFYDINGAEAKKGFYRLTNHAGGIEGGVTNGEDIIIRVGGKPLATLKQPLSTVDIVSKKPVKAIVERSDTCIIPSLAVICENAASLILAEAFLDKFGTDNLQETERNYRAFLQTEF